MNYRALLVTLLLASAPALAHDEHAAHHGFTFGEPGKADAVTRTVKVEASDEMRFKHEPLTIKRGETIRFVVTNTGKQKHEFSIGDLKSQKAHAQMMLDMPDMVHENDPTALTLKPGETGELIWKFSKPVKGGVVLACQVPGHFGAGMKSTVNISR